MDQADKLERFFESLSSIEMDLVGFKALATTIAHDLHASKALSDDDLSQIRHGDPGKDPRVLIDVLKTKASTNARLVATFKRVLESQMTAGYLAQHLRAPRQRRKTTPSDDEKSTSRGPPRDSGSGSRPIRKACSFLLLLVGISASGGGGYYWFTQQQDPGAVSSDLPEYCDSVPVSSDLIIELQYEVGHLWREIAIKLGASAGQRHDYDEYNTKISMRSSLTFHRMMTEWREKWGKKANIGLLVAALIDVKAYGKVEEIIKEHCPHRD